MISGLISGSHHHPQAEFFLPEYIKIFSDRGRKRPLSYYSKRVSRIKGASLESNDAEMPGAARR